MARVTDERRGAALVRSRRAIVAERGDVPGVGAMMVTAYLASGAGDPADLESNLVDMAICVSKHAAAKGAPREEVFQALAMPLTPPDDGTVLGGAVAACAALRVTARTSGIDWDELLGRVGRDLDVELPRPGM